VNYVSYDDATKEGLIDIKETKNKKQIYIGTCHTPVSASFLFSPSFSFSPAASDSTNNVANGQRGRNSVRIQTKESWNANPSLLFLMDVDHMPAGSFDSVTVLHDVVLTFCNKSLWCLACLVDGWTQLAGRRRD